MDKFKIIRENKDFLTSENIPRGTPIMVLGLEPYTPATIDETLKKKYPELWSSKQEAPKP